MWTWRSLWSVFLAASLWCTSSRAAENNPVIPHNQDAAPGPALSPEEAIAKMTVPEGFQIELVAAEPDIMNPVAMTFDERGRIWITESFEYPRKEAGPGRDRVKILEDTDHDGRVDKVTVFAEGLNIPSGIAVGHGGVWVANAPDILFLQDTDGDDRADKQEVVVTGFGRDDTHELPNSLNWGPDGWLYGLNGVFNQSIVKDQGKTFDFTCALFRIHPKTREFQLFCEGTSNPWGVTWDSEGSAFVSACVIDHLWHLTETGYYLRQGGPYPPFTWRIESIVDYHHQKAAYCGIHYFDSDAYPEQYRGKLYMGNIHGGCINCDRLERDGSTYRGQPEPDFLTANDAWFMPVSQKTGPDGCLYILDWYDRYHCYQDANRDPAGIDRGHGRLYRVRYGDSPRAPEFDLGKESDEQLVERLHSPNVYFRDTAQRILTERSSDGVRQALEKLVLDDTAPRKARMHALWALIGSGPLDDEFHLKLFREEDPTFRAWAVRAAGEMKSVGRFVRENVMASARDESPDVRLQAAIAARKLAGLDPVSELFQVLAASGDDPLIPHIVWNNLQPLMEERGNEIVEMLDKSGILDAPALAELTTHVIDRIVRAPRRNLDQILQLFVALRKDVGVHRVRLDFAEHLMAELTGIVQSREMKGAELDSLRERLQPALNEIMEISSCFRLWDDAVCLSASWNNEVGKVAARKILAIDSYLNESRPRALEALVSANDEGLATTVRPLLAEQGPDGKELRRQAIAALGRLNSPQVGETVLAAYGNMEPELRPAAIDLLASRAAWAKQLLAAVKDNRMPREAISVNHVRKLLASNDQELVEQVTAAWGALRTERSPERDQIIAQMREIIRNTPGDAHQGKVVFTKLCATCHKMYGEGQEVGPDITVNGRSSFEQLLSNVFDPSLVIGAAYQAVTVVTEDGRVLSGLLAEDNDQRVVLKVQGGKTETIARADVAEMGVSKLSLMPEDVEKQLQPQEIANLFAYITLDRPPDDPAARQLPGVRVVEPRESQNPEDYNARLAEVAPAFRVANAGRETLALLAEYRGRSTVVRTHPTSREEAFVLNGEVDVPAGKDSRLVLSVGCDEHDDADWRLVVRANGDTLLDTIIGPESTENGWADLSVDLSAFAGQHVTLELHNAANDWNHEFAYWGRAAVVSE